MVDERALAELLRKVERLEREVERLQRQEPAVIKYAEGSLNIAPTDAQLDGLFGNAADFGSGVVRIAHGIGSGNTYVVVARDGTWRFVQLTLAT